MKGKHKDRYYILHYPSPYGMGISTMTVLLKEVDLRDAIRLEVEKFMAGIPYSR